MFQEFRTRTRSVFPTLAVASGLLILAGCNVSDPKDSNEQESFTTVKLSYVNNADASDKSEAIIKFKEGFGHGGDVLEKNETVTLKANAAYSVELTLLDETKTPAMVMSEEVAEEGHVHQVFYTPASANLTVAYADKDKNNRPVGLITTQTTAAAGTGTLKVTLKHQQEGNTILKNDTSDINTGETDVEVTFNVTIQ
ncbi:MAG: hypothetical protein M3Y08_04285 [Fibrobacterota bacterium]|nr:hypothetical protein [Fibrobacterota bacterium]